MSSDSFSARATRRGFLQSAGALAGTPLIAGHAQAARPVVEPPSSAPPAGLTLKGASPVRACDPRATSVLEHDRLGQPGGATMSSQV